ncbi:hypothetical protein [Phaeospirillum tilakii]|uniref:Uncharacterized protein n=1 Tax=Phaeospirillum tilakii TaxID=741673 RepID=A0ABW5CHF8_9PROT
MPTDTEPDPGRGRREGESGDDEETLAALAATADPAERMRLMAALMISRALAAREGDGRDADSRIASAIRAAATATRVELAARKAQSAAGESDQSLAARLARAKQRLDREKP